MIFLDSCEPINIRTDVERALGTALTRVEDLPAGDYWIFPWENPVRIPHNVGEAVACLTAAGNSLVQASADLGITVEQFALEPQLWGTRWLASQCIIVERKEATDLLNTISGGRMDNQVLKMRALPNRGTLIAVAGYYTPTADDKIKVDGMTHEWNYWSLQSEITKIMLAGVPVVFMPESRFPQYLAHLTKWYRKEHLPVPPPPPHSLVPLDRKAAFLCGFPDIGPKTALAVLEFVEGNLSDALHLLNDPATPSMKERPSGLGPKTIAKNREFLGVDIPVPASEGCEPMTSRFVLMPVPMQLLSKDAQEETGYGPGTTLVDGSIAPW